MATSQPVYFHKYSEPTFSQVDLVDQSREHMGIFQIEVIVLSINICRHHTCEQAPVRILLMVCPIANNESDK